MISGLCSSSVISLKVSPTHQYSQTLIIGKPGEIRCGIEGKAAQVVWRKVGMKHRLRYSRLTSFNSKTLRFRRVQEQDAGQYVCRAISMSATVTAAINVSVEAAKGRLKLLAIVHGIENRIKEKYILIKIPESQQKLIVLLTLKIC